jgi:hypothetical protein
MEQVSWPHDPTGDRTCQLANCKIDRATCNVASYTTSVLLHVLSSLHRRAQAQSPNVRYCGTQAHRPRSKTLAEHSVHRIGKARAFTVTTLLAQSCDAPLLYSYAEPRGGTAATVSAGCTSAERTMWEDGTCSAHGRQTDRSHWV